MSNIVLKNESFELMGFLFRVHNQLGPSCKEKNYQDAVELIFKKEKVKYEREKEVSIPLEGDKLKGFFVDFIVFRKIILELKAKSCISREDIRQVSRYLQATGLPLAIIVNFRKEKLESKRVINNNYKVHLSQFDSGNIRDIQEGFGQTGKRYLGIDWGTKRIGLAIAESDSNTAVPYDTVGGFRDVLEIIREEEIDQVVIGRPTKMSGENDNFTAGYNEFFEELNDQLDIPVISIDERLTSRAADNLPGQKKDKASRDEIAAMLILQSYLDQKS